MYNSRRYLVIPASIIDNINFSQVYETSKNTMRYSVDGTKTFVKYNVNIVTENETHEIYDAETGEGVKTYTIEAGVYGRPSIYSEEYPEYTHEQFIEILSTNEWQEVKKEE